MNDKKIEGYWYSKYEPNYPKPIPNILTKDEAQKIHRLILIKQKAARIVGYKGFSRSRFTNEILGSKEYQLDNWIWPCDFAEHYVLKYRVKPTNAFLRFISYL